MVFHTRCTIIPIIFNSFKIIRLQILLNFVLPGMESNVQYLHFENIGNFSFISDQTADKKTFALGIETDLGLVQSGFVRYTDRDPVGIDGGMGPDPAGIMEQLPGAARQPPTGLRGRRGIVDPEETKSFFEPDER